MSKYNKNLFLSQSYYDAYAEYEKSLKSEKYPVWDYVILSASNEAQSESYRKQIEYRLQNGTLPMRTKYEVIADPDGKRVGSGGATLNIMKYIRKYEESFTGKKILVIHSGGDSKRVPQYSVCGKLFSPVPRALKDGRRSTLFDEFIIAMTGIPVRMNDGMLVCSGDVLLLFNALQMDFYSVGAAALSFKENVNTGKNHGVFVGDDDGNVGYFLHKQTVETLTEKGAVDAKNNVNIDTGAVVFDSNILNDLYSLVDTPEKFDKFVNEKVRISFYADFLYPLASKSTLEEFYLEQPEGDFSPELTECRREIWNILSKYKMKLLNFSPSSFIHFGTTKELLKLMTDDMENYKFLGWSGNVNTNSDSNKFASSNSYISRNAKIGDGSYIEDSYIHKNTVVGKNCIISNVILTGETIPDNTVLHGVKLKDGRYLVRMYGVNDNPKEAKWFGRPIPEPLWTYKAFIPHSEDIKNAVDSTLNNDDGKEKYSLCESFNMADANSILGWQQDLSDRIHAEMILDDINNKRPSKDLKKDYPNGISENILKRLLTVANRLDKFNLQDMQFLIRIYYYISKLLPEKQAMVYSNLCFETICEAVIGTSDMSKLYNENAKIAKDNVKVELPVRVNFGGGWSDTPPYCIEKGGQVLNAAVKVKGRYPIVVEVKKISKPCIILASEDSGSSKEFNSLKTLQNCNDVGDPFALHKAALIICGIIPREKEYTFDDVIKKLGGGMYLSTKVIDIPRGSGLGTSSILAGACVKALYEFTGVEISENELYQRVMYMEQIMSTGGGWQDQVGGLAKGIKMVSTDFGLDQIIKCQAVNISDKTIDELNKRFAVIYTGQRRLARNLLREVIGKYIGNDDGINDVLYRIQRLAINMKDELEIGNTDQFARLLSEHWECSKKLDAGCTNTCIDAIFDSIEDLIDGRMICGAGGGGFLQVVMKPNVTINDLNERFDEIFSGAGVEAWNCEFDF